MNRRGVLGLLSFGAVGVGSGVTATQSMASVSVNSDAEKDGPICTETLQLRSGTKKKEKENVKIADYGGISFYNDEYEEMKSVSMAVGQDGNLWLKSESGVWKRVVTE